MLERGNFGPRHRPSCRTIRLVSSKAPYRLRRHIQTTRRRRRARTCPPATCSWARTTRASCTRSRTLVTSWTTYYSTTIKTFLPRAKLPFPLADGATTCVMVRAPCTLAVCEQLSCRPPQFISDDRFGSGWSMGPQGGRIKESGRQQFPSTAE